jgi:membrane-associated phospholipid phosphatase
MTSDEHWASDVIVGDVVGFAWGYLLPTLVYYETFHIVPPPAEEQPSTRPRVAVLPVATPGTLELTAIGLF